MGDEKTFSISEAAAEVGVAPPTLRSWELRYRVVAPRRTAGGHRRYTEQDIDRLRVFMELAKRRTARNSAALLAEINKRP